MFLSKIRSKYTFDVSQSLTMGIEISFSQFSSFVSMEYDEFDFSLL